MKIKAITIDLWNTLFDNSYGNERNQIRMQCLYEEFAKIGKQFDENELKNAHTASWNYFNTIWKNDYRTPSTLETISFFIDYLKADLDSSARARVAKVFAESLLYKSPELIEGVQPALEILSSKYKLALVSDTGFSPGSILRELLKNKNIYKYFHTFSFSDETGVSKPHKTAYLTAINPLNVNPDECVHIGDIEETDIKGAKALDMKAIRFEGDISEFSNNNNPNYSAADFRAKSWHEIIDIFESGKFE